MKIIWLLFTLQTVLLCASAWLSDKVSIYILHINLLDVIETFKGYRLHQVLTLSFLGSIWLRQQKKIKNMVYYLTSRRTLSSFVLLLTYSLVVGLYLEILPHYNLYQYGIFLGVTAAIVAFPYCFPEDAIHNPTDFKENAYNFSLLGEQGQVLPISHPQTGIFIVGAPGCGKTKCVIEPILSQMLYKGYSGILYDYDFSPSASSQAYSLTHLAHRCLTEFQNNPAVKSRFISINSQDLSKSARINPIKASYVQDRKQLSHCIHTLLLNLSPQLAQKDDFWYKNAYALFKSVIVFLSNQYPQYCTLPHAILLSLQSHNTLMQALAADEEASLYASPILDAHSVSPEQFTGVIATFKVLLERLLDKHIFWVLSGDEVPLSVNDPADPLVVCLGNTPTEKGLLSPILSMIIAVLVGNMYGHGSNKSFLMLDELPTLILPHLSEIPATARKYNIATVVALQNMAQLEKVYTHVGAREIQDTFSNHFIGRGPFSLSKGLSDMIGKKETETTSTTKSYKQKSKTVHQKEAIIVSPQEAMTLKTGEFMGKVVHDSGGFFKMQLKSIEAYDKRLGYKHFTPLPTVNDTVAIEDNFLTIQNQVLELVKPYEKH
jgi:hypothetical protein